MSDEARKAEFWDRLLSAYDNEEAIVSEETYDLIREYRRQPLLDGRWCPACDKMDGHPKDRCPKRLGGG